MKPLARLPSLLQREVERQLLLLQPVAHANLGKLLLARSGELGEQPGALPDLVFGRHGRGPFAARAGGLLGTDVQVQQRARRAQRHAHRQPQRHGAHGIDVAQLRAAEGGAHAHAVAVAADVVEDLLELDLGLVAGLVAFTVLQPREFALDREAAAEGVLGLEGQAAHGAVTLRPGLDGPGVLVVFHHRGAGGLEGPVVAPGRGAGGEEQGNQNQRGLQRHRGTPC